MQKVSLEELPVFVQSILMRLLSRALRRPEREAFLSYAPGAQASIIALSGNLGSGKTTFTQALAKTLGVTDVVQSPTYVLMKSYPIDYQGFTRLVHIDAYRLEKPEEFVALKPEEFLQDPHTLVVVEWPERLEEYLPPPDLTLTFSADPPDGKGASPGDKERYIEVHES